MIWQIVIAVWVLCVTVPPLMTLGVWLGQQVTDRVEKNHESNTHGKA